MIKIEIQEDRTGLEELASKYGLNLPTDGICITAKDEQGNIKGFVNLRAVLMVEPVVVENNPLITIKLWNFIKQELIKNNITILRGFAKKEHVNFYKKLGFYKIFEDNIPMETNFYQDIIGGQNGG